MEGYNPVLYHHTSGAAISACLKQDEPRFPVPSHCVAQPCATQCMAAGAAVPLSVSPRAQHANRLVPTPTHRLELCAPGALLPSADASTPIGQFEVVCVSPEAHVVHHIPLDTDHVRHPWVNRYAQQQQQAVQLKQAKPINLSRRDHPAFTAWLRRKKAQERADRQRQQLLAMVEAKRQRLKEAECEAKFQQFLKRKGQRPAGKRRVLTNADKWKPAPSSSEQDAGSQVLTPGRKARLEARRVHAMEAFEQRVKERARRAKQERAAKAKAEEEAAAKEAHRKAKGVAGYQVWLAAKAEERRRERALERARRKKEREERHVKAKKKNVRHQAGKTKHRGRRNNKKAHNIGTATATATASELEAEASPSVIHTTTQGEDGTAPTGAGGDGDDTLSGSEEYSDGFHSDGE